MTRKQPPLDNKHYKAALMLARGDSPSVIASTLKIHRNTVANWGKRTDFQRLVEGLQEGLQETAEAALRGYLMDAVKTVGELAKGTGDDDAVRLRAAFGVLDRVGLPPTQKRETEHSGSIDLKGMTPQQLRALRDATEEGE